MVQDISAIATALGALVAGGGLFLARNIRQHQFEDTFIQRYWSLMDRLSPEASRHPKSGRLQERDEHVARLYFGLCEDELDLYAEGWISRRTSIFWARGVYEQMASWPYNQVWGLVVAEMAEVGEPRYSRLAGLLELPPYQPKDREWIAYFKRSHRWRRPGKAASKR